MNGKRTNGKIRRNIENKKERKRQRRKRRLWFLAGISFLFALGLGIFLWQAHGREETASRENQEEPENQDDAESRNPASENDSGENREVTASEPVSEMAEPEEEVSREELLEQRVEELLEGMTLEEKICQMFIITPEQLTGASRVTAAGEVTRNSLAEYPVGGLIYFASNLVSPQQTREMLGHTKEYAEELGELPLFLCVDEEGGRVARIGGNPAFGVEKIGPMAEITDENQAYEAGGAIGSYLHELGFNVDFAPDADVITNGKNTVIGDRSFGSDPWQVTLSASAVARGLGEQGLLSAFKHFPGHGAVEADTHKGYAYTEKTYEQLRASELIPFAAAQEQGIPMVMAAHISLPNVVGDDTPASMSHRMITEILRGDLGFQGLVVTDALNMGAVANNYSSGEAAAQAVEAGVDLLLMPKDFKAAREGLTEAVLEGRILEERIEESVRRIVRAKLAMEQ